MEAPRGKYAVRGSAVALTCPPGKYSNQAEAKSEEVCVACTEGKHSVLNGTFCSPCEPGTYGDQEGLRLCQRCAMGKAASDYNSTQCVQCDPGRYSSETGRAFCIECGVGKIAKTLGQTECQECDKGFTTKGPGQMNCTVDRSTCGPGLGLQDGVCVACSAGQYSDVEKDRCVSCKAGSYSDSEQSAECILCPPGRHGIQNTVRSLSLIHI